MIILGACCGGGPRRAQLGDIALLSGLDGLAGLGGIVLRQGDYGSDVTELQTLLTQAGFRPDEGVSGKFGPSTAQAVRDFQSAANLNPNAVVDQPVWDALRWAVGESAKPPPTLWPANPITFEPEKIFGTTRKSLWALAAAAAAVVVAFAVLRKG